jgi:cystathionine beta-synthase
MKLNGFDQLPVTATSSTTQLVGLVTLGNILAKVGSGRVSLSDPVSSCSFHFKTTKKFVEITLDTRLDSLSKFFETNSSAVVTEKDASGEWKVLHVVTKVDLLSYLVHKTGVSN